MIFTTTRGVLKVGNALELIKDVSDESVKLVLADYPFKVRGGRKKYFEFLKATAQEFCRVLTDDGWLAVINNPSNLFRLAPYLQDLEFRNEVVLVRPHSFHPPGMFGFKHNALWLLSKKKQKLNLPKKMSDVMEYQNGYRGHGGWHPEVIPEWLAQLIVVTTTDEGDVVLDPFLGSGTTAVVAERLGRRWIGFEINPEYAEIAVQRIKAELAKKKQTGLMGR